MLSMCFLAQRKGGGDGALGFPDHAVDPAAWVVVAGESCLSSFDFSVLPPVICLLAGEAQVLPCVREHQNSPGG